MGLFGKKKAAAVPEASGEHADILVLGSGCAKCNELEDAVRGAMAELGLTR